MQSISSFHVHSTTSNVSPSLIQFLFIVIFLYKQFYMGTLCYLSMLTLRSLKQYRNTYMILIDSNAQL